MKTTREVAQAVEQLRSLLQKEYGYDYEFSISGNGQVIAASSYVRHEVFPEVENEPEPPSFNSKPKSTATTVRAPVSMPDTPAANVSLQQPATKQPAGVEPETFLHGRPLYPDSILEWHSLGEWHRIRADSHDANPSMNHLQYIKMFPAVNENVYRWPDEKKR